MKTLLFTMIIYLCLCCSQKQNKNHSTRPKKIIKEKQDSTTITKSHYDKLKIIFGNDIKKINNDSILLFTKYKCKQLNKKNSKYSLVKFKDCDADIKSMKLNENFVLLESHQWYEEAIEHKDMYYKKGNNLIILDYLKYCNSFKPKNFKLESIRVFNIDDYVELVNKSNSVKYYLKKIN